MNGLRHKLRSMGQSLRLSGPAANDPTTRILHGLLLGLLAWTMFELTVALPFFIVRKAAGTLLIGSLLLTLSVSLVLLRRGFVRQASLTYLVGTGLVNGVTLVLSGGVHSPNIAIFITLPISAAWLFGHRAMLWAAAVCIGGSLRRRSVAVFSRPIVGCLDVDRAGRCDWRGTRGPTSEDS